MKRTFVVLSAMIFTALSASQVSAQMPPQSAPPPGAFMGGPQGPGIQAPGPQGGVQGPSQAEIESYQRRYGVHPFFAKLFRKGSGCSTCDAGSKHGKPAPLPPPPLPVANGGTLVFPHHQFVRSPRDFFMYGDRGPAWGE